MLRSRARLFLQKWCPCRRDFPPSAALIQPPWTRAVAPSRGAAPGVRALPLPPWPRAAGTGLPAPGCVASPCGNRSLWQQLGWIPLWVAVGFAPWGPYTSKPQRENAALENQVSRAGFKRSRSFSCGAWGPGPNRGARTVHHTSSRHGVPGTGISVADQGGGVNVPRAEQGEKEPLPAHAGLQTQRPVTLRTGDPGRGVPPQNGFSVCAGRARANWFLSERPGFGVF